MCFETTNSPTPAPLTASTIFCLSYGSAGWSTIWSALSCSLWAIYLKQKSPQFLVYFRFMHRL